MAVERDEPLEWVLDLWGGRASEVPTMTLLAQVAAGPTAAACGLARLCMRVDDAALLVFHLEARQRALSAGRGADVYDSLFETLKELSSKCNEPFLFVTEQGGGCVESVERFVNDYDPQGNPRLRIEPLTKKTTQECYDRGDLVVLYDPDFLKTVVAFWADKHRDDVPLSLDADRRTELFSAYVPPPHLVLRRAEHDASPKSADEADVFGPPPAPRAAPRAPPRAPPPSRAASCSDLGPVANPTTDALLRRARRALG